MYWTYRKKKTFKYICAKQVLYIEFKLLKRILKKLRKRIRRNKFRGYVFFCKNHAWFKKTKNARMGKGKGKYVRHVYISRPLKPLLIVTRISLFRLMKFIRYLNNLGNYFFVFANRHFN